MRIAQNWWERKKNETPRRVFKVRHLKWFAKARGYKLGRMKSRLQSMILVALIVLDLFLVLESLGKAETTTLQRAREATLSVDLCILRDAIDNYTADRQKPPRSLDDLVEAHYLREIPVDPITRKKDWILEFDDVVLSPTLKVNGISDVRSNSGKGGSCGNRHDIWLQ